MKSFFQPGLIFFLLVTMVPRAVADDTATKMGTGLQILLPAAAYGLTFHYHDKIGRKQFYKSFFSSMALTYALKFSIDDNRPNGSRSETSFISAHTAAAFSGAAFMQRRYGWKFGAPAYVLASYVGWSRVHSHAHDTDDVIRGAAIGISGAYLFARPIGKHAMMYPIIGPNTFGVGITASW